MSGEIDECLTKTKCPILHKKVPMTTLQIESTPQVQYPLRLDHQLHNKFYSLSKRTKIPMSTLGRLSITMFLDEVESRGITTVLNEMESV